MAGGGRRSRAGRGSVGRYLTGFRSMAIVYWSVRADRLDFRPRHRLTALVVQAVPLAAPVLVERTPEHAGCVSWVDLPLDPHWGEPVHDDASLADVVARVRDSVG